MQRQSDSDNTLKLTKKKKTIKMQIHVSETREKQAIKLNTSVLKMK